MKTNIKVGQAIFALNADLTYREGTITKVEDSKNNIDYFDYVIKGSKWNHKGWSGTMNGAFNTNGGMYNSFSIFTSRKSLEDYYQFKISELKADIQRVDSLRNKLRADNKDKFYNAQVHYIKNGGGRVISVLYCENDYNEAKKILQKYKYTDGINNVGILLSFIGYNQVNSEIIAERASRTNDKGGIILGKKIIHVK